MGVLFIEAPIWVLFLLWHSSILLVGGLNEEGSALLSFKGSIREDPLHSMANWNSTDENPCFWNGITCKEGKVVSLSIPKSGLLGSLPPSLSSLPYLRHINLRNNRLLGNLSPGFFNARQLQSLVLYGNSLSGSLPPEIGTLFYLQILDLSQNLLNGSIPMSLIQCKRLKTLVLSHNNLTDSLPISFGTSLRSLEKLDLSYNRLNGSIPSSIGNLSNLEGTADFSHNLFSGSIPASLGNLPEKVYIDLTYNNLSGPIPQSGALVNRGPTAFLGNPGLCGPPLKNPCSSSAPPPGFEVNYNASVVGNGQRLSKNLVIGIAVGDVVGIGLIALIFCCCYRRAISSKRKEGDWYPDKGLKAGKERLCCGQDDSETLSENMGQFDLIPLDRQVSFNLDELLKASAFVLGKSGIGIVYKVILEDGLILAVRRLGEGGSQRFKEFQTEVEAIGKVRHPNIVALRAYYWSIDEKLLVYDYIPNGNLSTAVHGKAGAVTFSPLSWGARAKIMKGIAKGLAFLHEFSSKKYVHGDLNPNNILLGLNMEPYISDFGLVHLATIAGGSSALHSNRIASEKSHSHFSEATVSPVMSSRLCYQAPEALRNLKPSQKWDVYSYGVILLELISGRSPVVLLDSVEMDLVRWVQFCIKERKPLFEVLDPILSQDPEIEDEIIAVLKIALACVQSNPDRRPSMKHVRETLERLITTS